jgi:hypothetical protein
MMGYFAGHIHQILHHGTQSAATCFTAKSRPVHYVPIVFSETFLTAEPQQIIGKHP